MRTSATDLLHADVALGLGLADAATVAAALQARWDGSAESVEEALGLEADGRRRLQAEVERLTAMTAGDVDAALRQRGGLDRTIHETVKPATARALLDAGVGARAPLRTMDPKRYRDFSLIGKGGMGVVYLAMDSELHRRVALKMVRPDPGGPSDGATPTTPLDATPPSLGEDSARSFEEAKTRFLQEAWITGAMEHPGVLPVYELGQTDAGIPYYTMRYVRGERTLKEALAEAEDTDDRLALVEPFLRVCDTLHYAHSRSVIHRDLKPENIALGKFGEVLVLDWGLSKAQGQPDITQSLFSARLAEYREATDLQTVAGVLGTPGYMAPEAAIGQADEVDAQSDVYSLGSLLFQILTGRLPHEFQTFVDFVARVTRDDAPLATEIAPTVPDELAAACAKALARDKADRFASAGEFAEAIRHWQTEGRVDAKVEELVDLARTEISRATEIGGNAGLWHLDRATAACTRALALRPDHSGALAVAAEAKATRESGIQARISTGRRRVAVIAAFLVLGVAAIVALSIAKAFADKREEASAELAAADVRAKSAEFEQERAERDRDRALARLADGHAASARALLADDRVAAAQLAAARGLAIAQTPAAWDAAARAGARWSPSLHSVLPDLHALSVLFSADGERLFAVCADRRILAIPAAGGEPVLIGRTLAKGTALALSPDGTRLAVATTSGQIRVWDLAGKQPAIALPKALHTDSTPNRTVLEDVTRVHNGTRVTAVLFLDDNTLVGAYTDLLRVWNIKAQKWRIVPPLVGRSRPTLLVRERGPVFWVGGQTGAVHRWTWDGRVPEPGPQHNLNVGSVAAILPAPDGYFTVGLGHRAVFMEFDGDTELEVFSTSAPRATSLAIRHGMQGSKKGPALSQILTSAIDGVVRVFDVDTKRLLSRVKLHSPATAMSLHEAAGLWATSHEDGTTRIWRLRPPARVQGRVRAAAAALRPAQGQLVRARPGGGIAVHGLADGSVRNWDSHAEASCVAALPSGPLVSGYLDGSIRLHGDRGGLLRSDDPITAIAGVDADTVLSGDSTGRVTEWSVRRRAGRNVAQGDGHPISAIAASADGGRIITGDTRGEVRVLDGASGEILEKRSLQGPVLAVAVSPNGETLAVAAADGRIRTWTAGESSPGVLAADNRTVLHLVVGDDGQVRFWNLALREYEWKPGAGARRAGKAAFAHAPKFAGRLLPWVQVDPGRRLIETENRYRMRMDGFEVRLVAPDEAEPDPARLEPWSR